jgi:integrase
MAKPKSRKKKAPKCVLALPDLEHAKAAVLNSLTSASGQRTYDHAIREFVAWYCSEPRLAFNRTVVLRYRIHLEQRGYAPATINLRLAAVRRIAYEAADAGLLSPELAAGIRRVKGVRRIGVRLGNWLTPEQGRRLLTCAVPSTARELRDHAMVATLIGCGLRRAELLALRLECIQQRDETLGHRRPGREGRTRAHGPHPRVGEEAYRCVDLCGGRQARDGLPCDQQGRVCLGRRHVAEGALGCRPRRSGSRRHREASPARPAAHLRRALPRRGWRPGSDPVPARPRLHPDDRALPRMQAEAPDRSERPTGHRTRCRLTGSSPGRSHDAPYAKGNFQFERVITGWRGRSVLDLRRK